MNSSQRGWVRRASDKAKRTSIMVFSEGEKTEPIYLNHWYRIYRDRVIVKIAEHKSTTPFELVARAAAQRERDVLEEKRGRGDAFDQYWCIFDVDEHPKIREAFQLAASNAVNIALSVPNIELWFLVHFDLQTAYIERREARRRAYEWLGCEKGLSLKALNMLTEKFPVAMDRARSLERKHRGDGSPRPWNPSSNVWRLIEVIRGPGSLRLGLELLKDGVEPGGWIHANGRFSQSTGRNLSRPVSGPEDDLPRVRCHGRLDFREGRPATRPKFAPAGRQWNGPLKRQPATCLMPPSACVRTWRG